MLFMYTYIYIYISIMSIYIYIHMFVSSASGEVGQPPGQIRGAPNNCSSLYGDIVAPNHVHVILNTIVAIVATTNRTNA